MVEFIRTWGRIMGAGIAFVFNGFATAQVLLGYQPIDLLGSEAKRFWVWIAIFILVGWEAIKWWNKDREYQEAKPNIKFKRAYPVQKAVYTTYSDGGTTNSTNTPKTTFIEAATSGPVEEPKQINLPRDTTDYYFALLEIVNAPEIRNEHSKAKDVIAGLRYFDGRGKPLVNGEEIIGRWWDEPEKSRLPQDTPPHTLEEVDISPSGKKARKLVLGMKAIDQYVLYAYNMDSTDYDKWLKREYMLGMKPKIVRAEIAGGNVNPSCIFWFRIASEQLELKVEKVEQPDWAEESYD